MASKGVSNNTFALCIIILIVVGLFLHYELGYNLDLFSVGGKSKHNRGGGNKHKLWHHFHPRYFNRTSHYVDSHDPNIFEKHNALQAKYDTLNTHHSSQIHEHGDQCPNCTSEDDPNKHTGGKVHSVTSV